MNRHYTRPSYRGRERRPRSATSRLDRPLATRRSQDAELSVALGRRDQSGVSTVRRSGSCPHRRGGSRARRWGNTPVEAPPAITVSRDRKPRGPDVGRPRRPAPLAVGIPGAEQIGGDVDAIAGGGDVVDDARRLHRRPGVPKRVGGVEVGLLAAPPGRGDHAAACVHREGDDVARCLVATIREQPSEPAPHRLPVGRVRPLVVVTDRGVVGDPTETHGVKACPSHSSAGWTSPVWPPAVGARPDHVAAGIASRHAPANRVPPAEDHRPDLTSAISAGRLTPSLLTALHYTTDRERRIAANFTIGTCQRGIVPAALTVAPAARRVPPGAPPSRCLEVAGDVAAAYRRGDEAPKATTTGDSQPRVVVHRTPGAEGGRTLVDVGPAAVSGVARPNRPP